MSTISVVRNIPAPIDQVWEALSDFGGVYRYSAGVESSPITAGTPERGVGAERICHLYDGNHIEERVTGSIDKEQLSVKIVQSSMPIKSADGVFDLVSTAEGGTQVTITMTFVAKFGPLGWLMDKLMMNKAMTKSLAGMLAALEHHLATGEVVEKGWTEAVAA
jgi:uncharacterized protein YndB with AHSA1/START domain